jgi:hypothetical protein
MFIQKSGGKEATDLHIIDEPLENRKNKLCFPHRQY